MAARRSLTPAAAAALMTLTWWSGTSSAQQQYTATAGNVTVRLTYPAGVTKARGVLAFTARGLASGWASSAGFRDLAVRLGTAIAVVSGGDDLNDASYPSRCRTGEFNNIPDAFTKLAMASGRPELAHAPLVGIGHSHGGDYWNYFNACHPERMAMVFVHASGGVNYNAAALKTPILYELGTGDLIENGSGKPRAGMFANRSKGAPMSLVIGQGEGHNNVSAVSLQMVITLIEAIFKLRVPADADPAAGPVRLLDIDEPNGGHWVGDLYTKEIAPWASYTGNKALTSFLPNEEIARKWKETGPGLPMNNVIPTGTCGWCGNPTNEPNASPNPTSPPKDAAPAPPADATAPANDTRGPIADAAPPSPPADAAAPPAPDAATITPPTNPPAPPPPGPTPTPPRKPEGGCGCTLTPTRVPAALLVLVAPAVVVVTRRRR